MSQLAEIEALVAVAEHEGFRAAAKALGVTASAVSKRIASLESRLGARLFNRTTRRVVATDVGRALYERSRQILADLEDAEESVARSQASPRGRLRVSAPMDFGRRHLAALLAEFAAAHPAVSLDVDLADRFVDVVGEGFDVVVRIGSLPDSSLVSRTLAPCRRLLVAAPAYLERCGRPSSERDIAARDRIVYTLESDRSAAGGSAAADPAHRSNNGEMIRALLLAGCGVALLPSFLVADDVRAGSLVPVLPHRREADLAIHALTPHRKLLSSKVTMLLDHLRTRLGPAPRWDRGLPLA